MQQRTFPSISGVYPHLAVWNHPDSSSIEQPQTPECGIGAVVPWAGRLWYLTYTSHALGESADRLYSVAPTMECIPHPASVGGTHACRMVHRETDQLFIGCYAISSAGDVRVISRESLPGRLTAVARHLFDPANYVYFYTQECSLYEVNVHTLEAKLLFRKPLPGWHAKGAYTAQGRLVVAHNGEEQAPSPFWRVDYADPQSVRSVEDETRRYHQAAATYGPKDWGVLGQWDGRKWEVISRRQHNDVNGPGGLYGAESDDEPIWAQGWDRLSLLLHVCHQGTWHRYRLPKGSYTYDGFNGSYTEWPRIRETTEGRRLMTMHGTFYAFPSTFGPASSGGLRPICTYVRVIPDFCRWGDQLVLAGQDASRIGVPWAAPGQSHSNLQFIRESDLPGFGPPQGYGGVWSDRSVNAGEVSDPMLVEGYVNGCLHIVCDREGESGFSLELDPEGHGRWAAVDDIRMPASGYLPVPLAAGTLGAGWMRIRSHDPCAVTAYMHLDSPRRSDPNESGAFRGLVDAASRSVAWSGGILQVPRDNHNLSFLARRVDANRGVGDVEHYEIDEQFRFRPVHDEASTRAIREAGEALPQCIEDAASFFVINADGRRLRLPKSRQNALPPPASMHMRDIREVVQERSLANVGGTFYEVPRYGVREPAEQRNLPDYLRMKPVASHPYLVTDFCVWRGMLVLSGVRSGEQNDHVFKAHENGDVGLWFGALDDLWKLGKPTGRGGPWFDTPVRGSSPSDPYLMTGFTVGSMTVSHRSRSQVCFDLEIDIDATGEFHRLSTFKVEPKVPLTFRFPEGFRAHWLRLIPERDTVATAQLAYD